MHPIFRDICNTIAPKVDVDFLVTSGGGRLLLTPLSKEGKDWCFEHLDIHYYPSNGSLSIPSTNIVDVVEGITSDGLKIRWEYR